MTERELTRLKSLPVPAPRSPARVRAMAAALEAFDAAPANREENSETAPQGSSASDRLTNAPHNPRSFWMRVRHQTALAASLAVAAIALPAAIYQWRPGGDRPAQVAVALPAPAASPPAPIKVPTQRIERAEAPKAMLPADAQVAASGSAQSPMPGVTVTAPAQIAAVQPSIPVNRPEIMIESFADLEERVSTLEAISSRKTEKALSGEVHRKILWFDFPAVDDAAKLVGSAKQVAKAAPTTVWSAGYYIEFKAVAVAVYANAHYDRRTADDFSNGYHQPETGASPYALGISQSQWYLKNDQLGTLSVGRLNSATKELSGVEIGNIAAIANADTRVVGSEMFLRRSGTQARESVASAAPPAAAAPSGPLTLKSGRREQGDVSPAPQRPTQQQVAAAQPPALAPSPQVRGNARAYLMPQIEQRQLEALAKVEAQAGTPPLPAKVAGSLPAPSVSDPAGRPISSQPWMPHNFVTPPHDYAQPPASTEPSRDRFATAESAPFKSTATDPVSTFSVDVDTASYAVVRRSLNGGRLPPKESVRIEEMLNYFPYAYPAPESASTPFQPTITVVPSPWNTENRLVHVALKGYALNAAERPRANLVLLIDISGSMGPADRLPLLKSGFRMLVEHLRPTDSVAIVTYANNTRVALEPTNAADKGRILAVIDGLQAGGGTYGEGGLQRAYALAEANFDRHAVNRVILATDGDFNIGISDHTQLKTYIEGKRQTGIFLSVLGVGMGNHNDRLMQALAQNGNGVAAYIDTLSEARKVLIEEASSSLFPIAKDVKIQIEFNPARVAEYRLIGYETRALKREDFNNDKVDAGDVGSGHAVTALYEIVPVGAKSRTVDDLRYSQADRTRREAIATTVKDGEYGFFKLRYKLPAEETSKLLELPIGSASERRSLADATLDVRWAVAVAAFGQLLQNSAALSGTSWDQAIELAQSARGDDPFGYRAEMITLMRLAKSLPR